jgi:Rab3 GTPase-activating protein non-catalytic subunit
VIQSSKYEKYSKESQQKIFGRDGNSKNIQLRDENQIITAILNFSVSGGTNYVDWTCTVIGLSSGAVQFYNSENGSLLYEKQFHNESVLNIRMVGDDITVFYPTCIAVMQTAHMVSMLKSLKEMFSKAKTAKVDLMDKDYMLSYKKWDYKNEVLISDALMIPQQKTCLFDHLVTESLELGFTKKYRIIPSQSASIVAVGSKPFLGFHLAREGFRQNVFTDVAKAVVNKITSRLP